MSTLLTVVVVLRYGGCTAIVVVMLLDYVYDVKPKLDVRHKARIDCWFLSWVAVVSLCVGVLYLLHKAAAINRIRVEAFNRCHSTFMHAVFSVGRALALTALSVGMMIGFSTLFLTVHCQDLFNRWVTTKLQLYSLLCAWASCTYWRAMYGLSFVPESSEEENRELEGTSPTDVVSGFETILFSEDLFGDQEAKQHPGQCSICIREWSCDDVIVVTPCSHIFHAGCLAAWLSASQHCPLCRRDVVLGYEMDRTCMPELADV